MNVLSENSQLYSLLSIGQRGVGKTVFLVGTYAELHPDNHKDNPQKLWCDCQDSDTQKTLENVLSYVARTGEYPPATMKLTNFDFSLKRQSGEETQTLCHFRWWDTPGESCKFYNPGFRVLVLNSDGCCVFIDALALLSNTEAQSVEELVESVKAIAELVAQNGLRHPFALILTKCDLLKPDPLNHQRLDESLQPLTNFLDTLKVNYKTFYSGIPIVVSPEGSSALKSEQAAAPVLWLASELEKVKKSSSTEDLPELVAQQLPNDSQFEPTTIQSRSGIRKYSLVVALILAMTLLGGLSLFLIKEAVVNFEQYRDEPVPTPPD
ncbi:MULTISPECIES: TRAFAC clade GTPase domain-containing protein [unclassified Coleofasciculus]|uniref:TRAFAC clade GTPase domain-containing protein n=1 Tax=unclassified Coleofasciculus TaxID=2692782 RepID=UPI00187E0A93|nr:MULTISPECIES: hypothetical protein [unclassified Coleofasciculus]MBE9130060.1 hypothetical protein [Coleofasciculus sp. LEGE 07081]MBE9152405.1 hypothetical protein [Coleofasciculus sp. LEGE 07092]